MPKRIVRRAGVWHFVRRVPNGLTALDPRGIVKQSTQIAVGEDPFGIRAKAAAATLNGHLEAFWKDLEDGRAADARKRYDAARRRARAYGVEYRPARDLAAGPVDEILRRVEILADRSGAIENPMAVAAVLGGEEPVSLLLSELVDDFESLTREMLVGMSPDQIRRAKHPTRRAVANLVSVVGNKAVNKLTRDDAIQFRSFWQDRVIEEGYRFDTANKDIGHLHRMLSTVSSQRRLGLDPVFKDLQLSGDDEDPRPPFDPAFVQSAILADGALDDLNEEARRVIYVMAETGLRPAEIVNLNASTIFLDAEVPHVQVRADGRRLKTSSSRRDVPLVGVALLAMHEQPEGFPRYHDKSAGLSATVNKFLDNHSLRPTEKHVLYSLRHTFKDRLRAVEAPIEMIDEFMGHSSKKPRYGSGHGLTQKHQWLQRIAFNPPSTV